MSTLTVAGGLYREKCTWPHWDQLFGSGGRAAAAACGHVDNVMLRAFVAPRIAALAEELCKLYRFNLAPEHTDQAYTFSYVHSLSVPEIHPSPPPPRAHQLLCVEGEVVLRFGMLEGSARVRGHACVYDPQSAFRAESFAENGSRAERLAIVGNRHEVSGLGGNNDPEKAANALLEEGAEVVVVKLGIGGSLVCERGRNSSLVPAFQTPRVWTIGSGDVFSAVFAAQWGCYGQNPLAAAHLASRAVSSYARSQALPPPNARALESMALRPAKFAPGRVYLAGPFFSLSQRWLVEETRRCLRHLGLSVFSPLHDVGPGPAEVVGPKDLKAIEESDIVFALLDGLDSGTLFEIGYARGVGKDVYILAQAVMEPDLKMIDGSGCRVYDDFATAIHHMAWRE